MKRRRTILLAAGAWSALLATSHAGAQGTRKPPRIAMPIVPPPSIVAPSLATLEAALREQGYVLGRDVLLDLRSADGDPARFPAIVRELVRSRPDVFLVVMSSAAAAVRAETRTIPIVMWSGTQVVEQGLVASLAKPGGNVTGMTYDVDNETSAKRFEQLKLALPGVRRVAVLHDPPFGEQYRATDEAAAGALGLRLLRRDLRDDIDRTFTALRDEGVDAVLFYPHARQFSRMTELVAALLKHRLPSSFAATEFVEAGGLMSYGPDTHDLVRRAAGYVTRILKGERPENLPVQRPVKLDLVINLRTARALGLTIPPAVLLRADRVIE